MGQRGHCPPAGAGEAAAGRAEAAANPRLCHVCSEGLRPGPRSLPAGRKPQGFRIPPASWRSRASATASPANRERHPPQRPLPLPGAPRRGSCSSERLGPPSYSGRRQRSRLAHLPPTSQSPRSHGGRSQPRPGPGWAAAKGAGARGGGAGARCRRCSGSAGGASSRHTPTGSKGRASRARAPTGASRSGARFPLAGVA